MNKLWASLLTLFLFGCAADGNHHQSAEQKQAVAKIHTELAASYYQRSQYAIALQELDVAMQANDKYVTAYNVRALVRMALREDQRAEADFKYALALDQQDSETHNNYGWFMCQRGREREAMQQFQAALANPLYATPEKSNLNAGLCAQRLTEFREADNFFQRALLLKANYAEALVALAALNYELNDYAQAKSYFMRYLQQSPELTPAQLLLAVRIEKKFGDRQAQESFTLQLRKHFPESREVQQL